MSGSFLGKIAGKFTSISNNMTRAYEKIYSWPCDLYLPINAPNPDENGTYKDINLYATHGVIEYSSTPNLQKNFYIPYLLRKEIMNSPEDSFDVFYNDEGEYMQPFIETSYENELPIMTKVGVHLTDGVNESIIYLMVEKKQIVNLGVGAHAVLRQYLVVMTGELPNE